MKLYRVEIIDNVVYPTLLWAKSLEEAANLFMGGSYFKYRLVSEPELKKENGIELVAGFFIPYQVEDVRKTSDRDFTLVKAMEVNINQQSAIAGEVGFGESALFWFLDQKK